MADRSDPLRDEAIDQAYRDVMNRDERVADRSDTREALTLADEIEANERELHDTGGGYQWEHLGDATKDFHVLIRGLRALEAERATLREAVEAAEALVDYVTKGGVLPVSTARGLQVWVPFVDAIARAALVSGETA